MCIKFDKKLSLELFFVSKEAFFLPFFINVSHTLEIQPML